MLLSFSQYLLCFYLYTIGDTWFPSRDCINKLILFLYFFIRPLKVKIVGFSRTNRRNRLTRITELLISTAQYVSLSTLHTWQPYSTCISKIYSRQKTIRSSFVTLCVGNISVKAPVLLENNSGRSLARAKAQTWMDSIKLSI